MYQQYKGGWLGVISGCMFAGRAGGLIRRIKVLEYTKKKIAALKPKIDDHYSEECVASYCGSMVKSFVISHVCETFDYTDGSYGVIVIDEVQLFDEEIVEIHDYFADYGKRVIVAGLDIDFRGESFSIMPWLLAYVEFVTKLTAVCTVCGAPATGSQRLIDDRTARYDDPIILVRAGEQYETRCRRCHEVLGKPLIHK